MAKYSVCANKMSPAGQLQPGEKEAAVVSERRSGRPGEDVESVPLVHPVWIDVENVSRTQGKLESRHWSKAELGVRESLPSIVLDIASAIAVESRRVLPIVGIARHSVPGAALVQAGHGASPRGTLFGDREQSALVVLVDERYSGALKLRRQRNVVLVRNRGAREVEDSVEPGGASQRRDRVVSGDVEAAGAGIDGVREKLRCRGARADIAQYRGDAVGAIAQKSCDRDPIVYRDVVKVAREGEVFDGRRGEPGAEVPRGLGSQRLRAE